MKKRKREVLRFWVWLFLIIMIFAVGMMVLMMQNDDEIEKVKNDGVPVMKISLASPLEEMKAGDKSIEYTGNHLWIDDEDFGEITIKGRGNTTWAQEKKPWQIEFAERTELLNMTSVKKWVLLAGVLDDSHLRDFLALELESMITGEKNLGRFVEVKFNDEYEGLFYLTPKIVISKGMVDLKNKYGVLVEIDNLRQDEDVYYVSYGGNRLFLKDAVANKDEEVKREAMADFLVSYNELEKAILAKDYQTITELADVQSLAKAYIVNEFTVDPDAYRASYFLYKDGLEDKIHVGPMWDFDYAFGNFLWPYVDDMSFYSPTETMAKKQEILREKGKLETVIMMYYLVEIPEFQEEVKKVYQECLEGKKEEYISKAKEVAELIQEAIIRDAEKWNYEDFESETKYVLDWVEKRYEYFDEVYGSSESIK